MTLSCVYADASATVVRITYVDGTSTLVAPDYPGLARQPGTSVADVLALLNKTVPDPYVAPTPSTNPLDYVLTKHQVTAALILAGVATDPDTFVMGVLNTIPNARAKALAINDWNFSPTYHRDNALFNDPSLLAASGITSQQIDQFWLLGAQQPV